MLAILPFLAVLAAIGVARSRTTGGIDWREAMFLGAQACAIWTIALTETLSAFDSFMPAALIAAWSILVLTLLAASRPSGWWRSRIGTPAVSKPAQAAAAFVALIVISAGFLALLTAPNNSDAMTYHLPRAMHWLANGSVAHYAAHDLRQLYNPPFAEIAAAHLIALGEGDRAVQLVQWSAMVGSILGASLIAKQLGASPDAQVATAFVAATIPTGILQATTAENDYVVSFWLVGLAIGILSLRSTPGWQPIVIAAASAALALVTKGTAYILGAPWGLWLVAALARRDGRRAWKPVLVVASVVLLVNAGHLWRNQRLFGSPLGPQLSSTDYRQFNENRSLAVALSNAVRIVAPQLESVEPLNTVLRAGVDKIHEWIGQDVNDPRSSRPGYAFVINRIGVSEYESGNPLHIVLFAPAVLWAWRTRRAGSMPYVACLVAGFVLFVALLAWSPFRTRLLLPLFVLASPPIGMWLADGSRRIWRLAFLPLLAILSLPFILLNPTHRVLGPATVFSLDRVQQMFFRAPSRQAIFESAASLVTADNCGRIGWIADMRTVEYPVWPLLSARRPEGLPQMDHVDVSNVSRVLEDPSFEPCAVICVDCPRAVDVRYSGRFERRSVFPTANPDPVIVFTSPVPRAAQ
jgi:hypothetical protein